MTDKLSKLAREVDRLVQKNNRLTTRVISLTNQTTILTQQLQTLIHRIEEGKTKWSVSKTGKYFHIREATGKLVASVGANNNANTFTDAWNEHEKLSNFSPVRERKQKVVKIMNSNGVFVAKFFNESDVELLFENKISII